MHCGAPIDHGFEAGVQQDIQYSALKAATCESSYTQHNTPMCISADRGYAAAKLQILDVCFHPFTVQ